MGQPIDKTTLNPGRQDRYTPDFGGGFGVNQPHP
jgi:hypothetical protein